MCPPHGEVELHPSASKWVTGTSRLPQSSCAAASAGKARQNHQTLGFGTLEMAGRGTGTPERHCWHSLPVQAPLVVFSFKLLPAGAHTRMASWKAAESLGSGSTHYGSTTRLLLPEQEIPPRTGQPQDVASWSQPTAVTSSLSPHPKRHTSVPARTLPLPSALGWYPWVRWRLPSSSMCWLAAEL